MDGAGRRGVLPGWIALLAGVFVLGAVWTQSAAQNVPTPIERGAPHLHLPAELKRPEVRRSAVIDGLEAEVPEVSLDPLDSVDSVDPDETGLASWYGARFHRRRTASGELFDMRGLTAAHPSLPFGSYVCVRSRISGRSVVVRINDRGPFSKKRVIDLSQGAAEVLGMVGMGLKPVEIYALDDGEKDCPDP